MASLFCGYLILESLLPLRTPVQIGGDEGFELAKATLCLKGYKLYEQVWNDQPPLHTWMVTRLLALEFGVQDSRFKVDAAQNSNNQRPTSREVENSKDQRPTSSEVPIQNPQSPLGPRLVSVFFGAVMIWALFSMARRVTGLAVAVVACVMLICSPGFLGLGASVMLEVPSLATALAAGAILVKGLNRQDEDLVNREIRQLREKEENLRSESNCNSFVRVFGVFRGFYFRLLLGGVVFGCAVMMKLVPLMLVPIFFFIIFLSVDSLFVASAKSAVSSLLRFCVFGLVSAVTFVVLDLGIDGGAFISHFAQTWASHFGPQKSFEYGSAAEHAFDWTLLWKNWDVTVPAVVGVVLCLMGVARSKKSQQRTSTVQHPTSREGKNSNIQHSTTKEIPKSKETGRDGLRFRDWSFFGGWRLNIGISVLPFVWLVYSVFVFAVHRPWWAYYYVHIAVPLCWCAAIGMVSVFDRVAGFDAGRKTEVSLLTSSPTVSRKSGSLSLVTSAATRLIFGLFVLGAAGWAGGRVYLEIAEVRRAPKVYSDLAIAEMKRFKPFVEFMYADEPVYSFHTGIPMVPNLAVIMLKRLWSGDMTNEKIAAELGSAKPGLILLKNDTRVVPFKELLETEYRLVYYDSAHRLYAHKSVARKSVRG